MDMSFQKYSDNEQFASEQEQQRNSSTSGSAPEGFQVGGKAVQKQAQQQQQ